MSTRRNFSAEFKAKVALGALVGDKTLAHILEPAFYNPYNLQSETTIALSL